MDQASGNSSLHDLVLEFSWIDYGLFAGLIILSVAIGIYYGCFGTKQKTKSEYLLGGKTMRVIPIAISLIASDTSGIVLLAVPADIYRYGANYIWSCVSAGLACTASAYIYLPVFHKLQLTSSYEYLKLRFDSKIRLLASLLFALSVILYNSIVIYIPALALQQSTGLSVHLVAPTLCAICIFYTTIGGLKAVVWTDIIQMVAMTVCMVMVFVLGIILGGGPANIIAVATKGHRLDIFNLNINPTLRDGMCALLIGATINSFVLICVSQTPVQRYLSIPSLSDARKAVAIFGVGIASVKVFSVTTGLVMYTRYATCDPLTSGIITHADQILPYYIMDVGRQIPGLSGIFIAGIFSASFSTLSATLNTLAATVYEDFVLRFLKNSTEKSAANTLRLITVVMGVICTSLVLLVEQLGGILPLSLSFAAITGGPLVGLFTLGMLFPIANAKGALYGAISGISFITWIIIGNQWYKSQSFYIDPVKPVSVLHCSHHPNITVNAQTSDSTIPFYAYLYGVSPWYYTLIGTTITICVGVTISWFTRSSYPPVNEDLLNPYVVKALKRRSNNGSEHNALNVVEKNDKC